MPSEPITCIFINITFIFCNKREALKDVRLMFITKGRKVELRKIT